MCYAGGGQARGSDVFRCFSPALSATSSEVQVGQPMDGALCGFGCERASRTPGFTAWLGKISPWVNVHRLKFFEQQDAKFSDFEALVLPTGGGDGSLHYEIQRIWGHRPQRKLPAAEYLVQWQGYDTSQMQ